MTAGSPTRSRRAPWWPWALAAGALLLALATGLWRLNLRDEPDLANTDATLPSTPELIARGAYLARAGNCMTCHTTRGGAAYAGGRGIDTPFGTVYSSNLTPDAATGLGDWSATHFWRALHNGRSRDGRLLYPAFPYTRYSGITRADSDALFAFLRSLPAVTQAARPHDLRWPYRTQAALAVWRALYFTPGAQVDDPGQGADWNRGAYLVNTLGHCSACHGTRNALGATRHNADFAGGLMPMQNWYAPSLTSATEASVAAWATTDVVTLLKTGVSPRGPVTGPMAEVVQHSTQYLSEADLAAMASYLKALPPGMTEPQETPPALAAPSARIADRGAQLYEQHCAQCHGRQGEGVPGAYPPLAGNRAVTLRNTSNLVQMLLYGGFAPTTAGNPRPYGMPPYVLVLSDADVAAVLTHVRTSWGNRAALVSELEVSRLRDR